MDSSSPPHNHRDMLAMSHLFDRFPGQTHRQEEEDVGEVLQLEPLLERIIRLPYRRDGHEASVD